MGSNSSIPESQDSVYSEGLDSCLYLSIQLKKDADAKRCAVTMTNVHFLVDKVAQRYGDKTTGKDILIGIGFGYDFYNKLTLNTQKSYELLTSGGDIFVHAKANTLCLLYFLTQEIITSLPEGSVEKYEDIYGTCHDKSPVLWNFFEGVENPSTPAGRQDVAVEKETGGSYAVTQNWVYDISLTSREGYDTFEKFLWGQQKGNTASANANSFRSVRQAGAYGHFHDKVGLSFIAYSASPDNFTYILDQTVGKPDNVPCLAMDFSKRLCSAGWYFPGKKEMENIRQLE